MTPAPPHSRGAIPQEAARRLGRALSLLVLALVGLTLVGMGLGYPALAAFGRDRVPLSPLAATQLILLCSALGLMQARVPSALRRYLSCGLAALVALLNLGFIAGHVLGDAVTFERWLVAGRPEVQLTSILTDIALLGAALSLLFRWWLRPAPWVSRQVASLLALVPLLVGMVVLVSYAAAAPLLYGSRHIPMSLPVALCSVALGLALNLAAECDTWPLAAFWAEPGGKRGWSILGISTGAVTVFLLVGTLLLIGGSLYLRGQIREARARIQAELLTIADLKAQQITTWLGERRSDADLIAHSDLIRGQLSGFLSMGHQGPTAAAIQGWMGRLQSSYKYSRVELFDAKGRGRISVPRERDLLPDDSERRAIDQTLQGRDVWVEDLHQNTPTSDIHLSLWVPIRTGASQGRAEGALRLMVDPRQFLFPLVQSWPTSSPSAETLLIRREGDQVLFLNDLRHRARTAMNLRIPMTARPDLPATRALQGAEGLVEANDYRGVSVLSVVRPIAGTGWFMVTKVDTAEIYGPLRNRIWVGGVALLGMLGLVGAGLGLLLRRHDAEMVGQQLHLAQRFEWIMREANDMIFLTDDQGAILEANTRAIETYGYEPSEFLGMNIVQLRASESSAEGSELFDLTKSQRSLRFDSLHRRKDGGTFPVEVSARTMSSEGRLKVIVFVRDFTERHAQELELLRMNRLYAALSQVNQAIVQAPNREVLFDRICEAMVEYGRFDMAWIGLEDLPSLRVNVASSYGDTHGYLTRILAESGPIYVGSGPMGTAIKGACPCVENDYPAAVLGLPWAQVVVESGFKSMAAFPIRKAGQVVGALAVYAKETDFFGPKEAALLEEAAMDASFALDHLAGEDQRRGTEAALLESERQLREAQEAGGVGTYTWFIQEDHWWSSAYLDQVFGIGPDYPRDLAGWNAIIAPEFQAAMYSYVVGIIERHERFDLDYPIIRVADGTARWVHGQGDIQRDAAGQPVAMVGIIQDITERKSAEQALRKISVAVEQSPLSIVITDPKGTIEFVNPAFSRVTGYTAEETLGQNPRILKSPRTPPEIYRNMWETLARGAIWVGEFENLKKNGEPFLERATIAPVCDDSGALVNYIAIKEDITQQKRDEVERHSLESQLHQSQKLESLGSLAGGVAHDMNNVLGAILGLASALRESAELQSPAIRSLDTIVNACMRGRGVVKSLLYFAKKDLQEERPIDLNELVGEMTQLLNHTMLKRVLLSLDLADGLGLVRCDPGAVSHALMNLCVNAMDAMDAVPNGGTLQIATSRGEGGGVQLRVRDTGEGMNPEILAKAMEPFFTTKPQGKGTGLGLAMVYGTMKAHEGTFTLQSEPGQGTEAILGFPASRVEAVAPPVPVVPLPAPEWEDPLNILLVDDDELIREAVAPLLEVLGHTVVTMPGGAEALRWLESGLKVDLAILDMNMPGMNGAEVLPRLLALRPGLAVIMATGYSDQELAPLLVGHPTVASLRKPFTLREVRQAIKELHIQPGLQQEPKPTL